MFITLPLLTGCLDLYYDKRAVSQKVLGHFTLKEKLKKSFFKTHRPTDL